MKAVVMETRGRKAAVLLKDGTFRVARGRYSVGETIDYQTPAARRWLAAAAAVVVGLGLGGGAWYDSTYVAYGEVSIDAEPSIVYTVNKRNQVLSVTAANEEAAGVVSALEADGVRFAPIVSAVEKTMAVLEAQGYLNEGREDYVLVNVSAEIERQSALASQVAEGMKQIADSTVEYRIDQTDRDTARRAAAHSMSAGRYAAWEAAGDGSAPGEYAEKPVREIMGRERPNDRPGEEERPGAAEGSVEGRFSEEQPDGAERPEDGAVPNAPADSPPENEGEGLTPGEMPRAMEEAEPGEIPDGGGETRPGENGRADPAGAEGSGRYDEEPTRPSMENRQPAPNEEPPSDGWQPFGGAPGEDNRPQR